MSACLRAPSLLAVTVPRLFFVEHRLPSVTEAELVILQATLNDAGSLFEDARHNLEIIKLLQAPPPSQDGSFCSR